MDSNGAPSELYCLIWISIAPRAMSRSRVRAIVISNPQSSGQLSACQCQCKVIAIAESFRGAARGAVAARSRTQPPRSSLHCTLNNDSKWTDIWIICNVSISIAFLLWLQHIVQHNNSDSITIVLLHVKEKSLKRQVGNVNDIGIPLALAGSVRCECERDASKINWKPHSILLFNDSTSVRSNIYTLH